MALSSLLNDLSTLELSGENLISYVKETVSTYFIQPSDDIGIGGLKLDIIGEQTLTIDSDVTDNYVESNTAYQDQISLKPITYTIQGEVGELVYYEKNANQTYVGYVAEKISDIASFLPTVSSKFYQVSDAVLKATNIIDSADNIITRLAKLGFKKSDGSDDDDTTLYTQQQVAYMALIELRNARAPITVNSPWTQLENYVIQNIKITQPERTKDKSYITLTLKEFRTTELATTSFNSSDYLGRLGYQKAETVDQGNTTGVLVSTAASTFMDPSELAIEIQTRLNQ